MTCGDAAGKKIRGRNSRPWIPHGPVNSLFEKMAVGETDPEVSVIRFVSGRCKSKRRTMPKTGGALILAVIRSPYSFETSPSKGRWRHVKDDIGRSRRDRIERNWAVAPDI